ncbi:uncharacterized protein LOC110809051 [Carica papaya]|uniref:uncharacterized protein LOC110809051 n=1 Tax=Carica papaya TaxID=3649 RepID=UPI000B8D1119|nr:uncharacterized protein LOC110809051 [Carica papaya]
MRRYEDDLDEYEEYEEEGDEREDGYEYEEDGAGYEEAEEGEEEEEKEERKPTQEELEYLELRQRLKDSIRKKMKKESSSARMNLQEKKRKLPYDNYGSFFGPSQPVIAQRVIQESKSFLENQHLESRILNSNRSFLCFLMELSLRAQFVDCMLWSGAFNGQMHHPRSGSGSLNGQTNHARTGSMNGQVHSRSSSVNGPVHSKPLILNSASSSKSSLKPTDSRKHVGSNNGIGPGRPVAKTLPPKTPVVSLERKASVSGAKDPLPNGQKLPSSKMHSSDPRKHMEQRKGANEPNKPKIISKQSAAPSKPQMNKPLRQISSHNDHQPKKKPVKRSEDEIALDMIRKMFNSKIAKKEDEEQLRLIEEEERQERMRKLAKKRKLSHH